MCLTQTDVGARCGIRFQQIQKYECAANHMSAAMLWRIAEVWVWKSSTFSMALVPQAEQRMSMHEDMSLAVFVLRPTNKKAEQVFCSAVKI